MGRNTAPAIAAAALHVQEHFGDQAQLLILPADHLIRDEQAFAAAVAEARGLAAQGYLVTFGITPERAETGFGYIEQGAPLVTASGSRASSRNPTRPPPSPTWTRRVPVERRHVLLPGRHRVAGTGRHAPEVLIAARAAWPTAAAWRTASAASASWPPGPSPRRRTSPSTTR